MKSILALIGLIALSGCVDRQTFFHRPDDPNAIASCKAAAWGIIPTLMELSSEEDCEKFYINHGYIRS